MIKESKQTIEFKIKEHGGKNKKTRERKVHSIQAKRQKAMNIVNVSYYENMTNEMESRRRDSNRLVCQRR